MQGACIILNKVCAKQHGNEVLKDISFSLQPGEHLAITGPSGSGKTTLAKLLAGQLCAQGGIDITWDESSALQKKVVLVEQRNQFKNLSHTSDFYYQQRFNSFDAGDSETVWETLKDADTKQNDEAINFLLKQSGLDERRNAPLIQLSSGENKRLQLIKAILSQPQILILDLPFTGLDANARQHLDTILCELAAGGTKIIMITDAHKLPDCITHLAILQKGELKNFIAKEDTNQDIDVPVTKPRLATISALPLADTNNNYRYIINMRNVSVQYSSKTILNNINWQVRQGDKWWVKGPNGAGKSTLLSLINGDNPQAYKNEIYLFDKRRGTGESIWDIKSKIGYVSPELHAFYDKTISGFHTIASGFFDTIGLLRKLSSQQQEQVQMWMEVLGLQSLQHKALAALSFSNQRVILLARALVKNPLLLILDEPCQGLDEEQRESFVSLINQLSEHFNKTLIYVSHYDNEIPGCIEHTLVLSKGEQKINTGQKEDLFISKISGNGNYVVGENQTFA